MSQYNRKPRFCASDVIDSSTLLENSLDWIKSNLTITDVYDENDIIEHVALNSSPGDVFDEEDLKSWARDKSPEEIFSSSELEYWAEDNGFVKFFS